MGHKIKGGRPKGSKSKPQLSDYLASGTVKRLVDKAILMAENGDPIMLKFILEHHFGKAVQSFSNPDGTNIMPDPIAVVKRI